MHAGEIISEVIPVLKTTNTGIEAMHLMDEARVEHLPMIDGERFLGLISEEDILDMDDPERSLGVHKLSLRKPSVLEHQHIFEAIRLMAEEKLSILPVLDEHFNYLGSIAIHDLLRYFAHLSAARNPGGIIVLEVNQNDFVMSEIASIVESNDAKILSMYLGPHEDSTKLDVTIKINRMDMGAVLQTFDRYDYIIKATFTEGEYSDDLRERYESLMRYLNI